MNRGQIIASYVISNAALGLITFVVASVWCGRVTEGLEIAQAPLAAPLICLVFLVMIVVEPEGLELNPLTVLGALAAALGMSTACSMVIATWRQQNKRWFVASHVLLVAYWIVAVLFLHTFGESLTLCDSGSLRNLWLANRCSARLCFA